MTHKVNKKPKTQPRKEVRQPKMKGDKRQTIQKAYNIFSGIGLLLSFILAFYAFLPKINLTIENPNSFENILQIIYKIENKSILPIYDVAIIVKQNKTTTTHGIVFGGNTTYGFLAKSIPSGSYIEYSFPAVSMIGGYKITSGTMEVIIIYKLPILGLKLNEKNTFIAGTDKNGNTYWFKIK